MCVQYNLDFNTVDIWRAICESMPEAGFCWLEGCDNSLAGYRSHAVYCSPECKTKGWNQSPEKHAMNEAWNKANPEYYKDYERSPARRASKRARGKVYYARKKDRYNANRRAKRAAERLAAEEQTST